MQNNDLLFYLETINMADDGKKSVTNKEAAQDEEKEKVSL